MSGVSVKIDGCKSRKNLVHRDDHGEGNQRCVRKELANLNCARGRHGGCVPQSDILGEDLRLKVKVDHVEGLEQLRQGDDVDQHRCLRFG